MVVAPRALKISGKNAFVKKVILMEIDGSKQMSKKLSTKLTTSYSELIDSIKVSDVVNIEMFYVQSEINQTNNYDIFRLTNAMS